VLFPGGFTFSNFVVDVLVVFLFVMWFWLFVIVVGDLIRRRDVSGWGKAIWVVFMLLVPHLGVLAYLIFQGGGMVERQTRRAEAAQDELRRVVGFSIADELSKLEGLKSSGKVTEQEFTRLRAKLVQ